MTRFRIRLLCLAATLVLTTAATSAFAQGNGRQSERSAGPPQSRVQQEGEGHDHDEELSNAVRRVVREQRGRVLSAERVQYEGREVNRIKVIDDQGRVRVYVDDPHRDDKRERRPESP